MTEEDLELADVVARAMALGRDAERLHLAFAALAQRLTAGPAHGLVHRLATITRDLALGIKGACDAAAETRARLGLSVK